MEESGYRMLDMINLSLDLFKMERGIYQFNPVPVDILQVIRKIMREPRHIIETKELEINIILHGREPHDNETFRIQGEELLCYPLLANLIKNALEASPDEEQITITLEHRKMSVIHIHNKGTVPKEIRDKFFEKYVTYGKRKGTGLGTYSAKLIAEALGGSIHLHTSDDHGTTVTIYLPSFQGFQNLEGVKP
jgi:signal transduction histidine kinase